MVYAASHGFEAAQVSQGHRVDAPVSALRMVGGEECASGGCRVDSRGRGARFKLPDGGEGTSCATGALASALARPFWPGSIAFNAASWPILPQIAADFLNPTLFYASLGQRTAPATTSRGMGFLQAKPGS